MAIQEYRVKTYQVTAERVNPGTILFNMIKRERYVTDERKCIKITGTVQEKYPISIERLVKNFTYLDGKPINPDKIPEGKFGIVSVLPQSTETIFAERVTGVREITTKDGKTATTNCRGIPHGSGDYIVYGKKEGKPSRDNMWIINGLLFPTIYELVSNN